MIGVTGRGRGFNLPGEPLLRKLHRSRASRNITVAGLGAALMVSILPSGAWSQARVRGEGAAGANDVPASTVNISGFGFGHGLGMGQWGAYGYASVYHWDYKKILAHYYGGTTLGTLPSPEPPVRAHLVELDGHSTIASALSGGRLVASWGGNATFAAAALDVSRSGGGEAIFSGPGCAGPWSKVATTSGPVTIASAEVGASGVAGMGTAARADRITTTPSAVGAGSATRVDAGTARSGSSDASGATRSTTTAGAISSVTTPSVTRSVTTPGASHSAPTPGATGSSSAAPVVPAGIAVSELQACLPGVGLRTYRGDLVAQPDGQTQDVLPLEAYLEGVVPAESPPSWMGTGGEAALQALAVAARSVAVALVSTEGAICDTTQCQVYEGVPNQYGMTAESAVTSTSGQVLYCGASSTCGAAGSIAVAEYSSSTGGYTAGGPFPPVPDLGDSVASNPVHAWTVRVPLDQVQSTFPSIGELRHVTVTKRNGLGQIGGRVEELELIGNQGSAEPDR